MSIEELINEYIIAESENREPDGIFLELQPLFGARQTVPAPPLYPQEIDFAVEF